MINIPQIKGLKYPDEYFIKFFFNNRLHEEKGLTYLEFGCGNSSNLMLPYSYRGNKVIGIDYNASLIDDAKFNFNLCNNQESLYEFYADDMREFVANKKEIRADILSLPNIINYISTDNFIEFLSQCKNNMLYKKGAKIFIRYRTPKDFRFGLGKRMSHNSYRIEENNNITGEASALNCFYNSVEMIAILKKHLNLSDYEIFTIEFDNLATNGDTIHNSDIVIWGTIN